MEHIAPTSDEIRSRLIERAEVFAKRHQVSFSKIGLAALNDSKFLSRVKDGEKNFTIKSYQAVIDWMDEYERAAKVAAE